MRRGDVVFVAAKRGLKPVRLGARLGKGRVSVVFALDDADVAELLVAKMYIASPPEALHQLIDLLRTRGVAKIKFDEPDPGFTAIAVPKYVIYTEALASGLPAGVATLRVDLNRFGEYQKFVASPVVRNLELVLRAAERLAAVIEWVHARHFVVGDLSGTNVQLDVLGNVSLVDVDSFGALSDEDDWLIRPTHYTPNYAAPESRLGIYGYETDQFILGVMILQLLLGGMHPYGGTDPRLPSEVLQDNINHGRSWLLEPGKWTLPPAFRGHPGLAVLPAEIRALASSLIEDGPRARPSAQLWRETLAVAREGLSPCASCGNWAFLSQACLTCALVAATRELEVPTGWEPTIYSGPGSHVSSGASSPPASLASHRERTRSRRRRRHKVARDLAATVLLAIISTVLVLGLLIAVVTSR